LVLVTKLTAVLKARSGRTAPKACGFNGRTACARCTAYSNANPTKFKASIDIA
jgi:hypothetical protein